MENYNCFTLPACERVGKIKRHGGCAYYFYVNNNTNKQLRIV